jgi:hypothetical protein
MKCHVGVVLCESSLTLVVLICLTIDYSCRITRASLGVNLAASFTLKTLRLARVADSLGKRMLRLSMVDDSSDLCNKQSVFHIVPGKLGFRSSDAGSKQL